MEENGKYEIKKIKFILALTDQQLLDFGERLIALDINNCGGLITTDYQGSIGQCSSSDNAPNP